MKEKLKVEKGKMLFLLIIIAFFIMVFVWKPKDQTHAQNNEQYTPTKEQIDLLQGKDVKLPLVSNILMGADQEEADVCFFNPESNTKTLTYALYIDDELVYESEEVKPGYAILHIKLNQPIVVGKHEGMVEIKSYDLETGVMSYGQKQRIAIDAIDQEEDNHEDNSK